MSDEHSNDTGCQVVEGIRTEPWTLDDFVPVFVKLGLVPDGQEYVSVRTVQTGRVVVNGVEKVQTQEIRTSFRFDKDFVSEMDGKALAGIWVTISSGNQSLLSELIYCVPEDMETYCAVYLNSK